MTADLLKTLTTLLLIHRPVSADSTPLCGESDTPCVISCAETQSCYAMAIDVPLSSSVLFNCSGDYSCEHLDVLASPSNIDYDHDLNEHLNFTIICSGSNSCNDATFDISGEYSLSLNCLHPNSCVDTAVTLQISHNNSTHSSPDSDVLINFEDSCSSFLMILCFDETSQCSLYCEDKYVLIGAEAFRVRTFDDADSCFEQQLIHSCPDDEGELEHTRAKCLPIYGVVTAMTTETIWNVRRLVDADLSDYCTSSPYVGEFEQRITTILPSYDMIEHEAQGARSVSVVVAIGCISVMLPIFAAIAFEMCRRAYRNYHKKFITARPPLYYLWGPFVCGTLITIAFCWWLIKGTIFESSVNAYCSANYPVHEFSQFRETCDNDDKCQLDKDGFNRKYVKYECTSAFTDFYIARWVIVSLFALLDLCRLCCCCSESKRSQHQCFILACIDTFEQRGLWVGYWPECISCFEDEDGPYILLAVLLDALLRYGIHFLFMCLHYGLYSPLLPFSDAILRWYDIWPVMCLVALKTSLHYFYLNGERYNQEKENMHLIREILVDKLSHSSLAAVVESYLPLYHDPEKCPAELLAAAALDCQKGTPSRCTNTKGGYLPIN